MDEAGWSGRVVVELDGQVVAELVADSRDGVSVERMGRGVRVSWVDEEGVEVGWVKADEEVRYMHGV